MITRTALILSVLVLSTSTSTSGSGYRARSKGKSAVLKLTASKRIADVPAKIRFLAYIKGGRDDDPSLYCPDVEWDFQHAVFRDTRDCPEYREGTRIQRAYEVEHTFEKEGVYRVEARLIRREQVVLRGHVEVTVRKTGLRAR